jgi:hypothetical protein
MLCRGELHKIPITKNRIEKELIADTVAPNTDTWIASRRVIQAASSTAEKLIQRRAATS